MAPAAAGRARRRGAAGAGGTGVPAVRRRHRSRSPGRAVAAPAPLRPDVLVASAPAVHGARGRRPLPRYPVGSPADEAPGLDVARLRRRRLPGRPDRRPDLRLHRRRHRGEVVGTDDGHRHGVRPARVVRGGHPARSVDRFHRRAVAGQPDPGDAPLRRATSACASGSSTWSGSPSASAARSSSR